MSVNIANGGNKKQIEEVSRPTFAERSLGSTKLWRLRAKIDFSNFEKRLLQHQLQLKENDVTKTISKQLQVRDRWAATKSRRSSSNGTHRELKQIMKETMHFQASLQDVRKELNDIMQCVIEREKYFANDSPGIIEDINHEENKDYR